LRIFGWVMALAVLLGCTVLASVAGVNGANLSGIVALCMVPAIIVVLVVVWRLATLGNALTPHLQRYELIVSDGVLRRSGIGPVAEVLRAEVGAIVETGKGLWISCTTPRRALFVSSAVDGYADVRQAVAAWAPIQSLRGWRAFRYASREASHQGPRDAILGTALATDASLGSELETVRAASANGHGDVLVNVPGLRTGRAIALWAALIVMFLAIWQVLQPGERRPVVMTDQSCRERPSCKNWGLCKARDSRCVAETDDDCLQSEACSKLGRCRKVADTCWAAAGASRPGALPNNPSDNEQP
jgi:hypothetical protein